MTSGLERLPDSLGHLVLAEDGAVVSSGGELENDEQTAAVITQMVQTAAAVPVTPDRRDGLRRMSVMLDDIVYMVTVSQMKIYVSKRKYNPQEPVAT